MKTFLMSIISKSRICIYFLNPIIEARIHDRSTLICYVPLSFTIFFLAIWLVSLNSVCILHAAEFDVEVNTGATYDSNVERSFINPKSDVYFTFAPRASMELPVNKLYFNSGIRGAIEKHIEDMDSDLQELVFSGLGRYTSNSHVSVGLKNDMAVSGRLRTAERLSDYTYPREFFGNNINVAFKYGFKGGKLPLSIDYTNVIRNYLGSEIDDWIANYGNLSVGYQLGHKTLAQFGIGLARKGYYGDNSYLSFPINALVKRDFTDNLDATFNLGIESRRYSYLNGNPNWKRPIVSLLIKNKFTQKTGARLLLQYRVYDSDIELYTGYAFTSAAVDTSMSLKISKNIKLVLDGFYSKNNYIKMDRNDDVLSSHMQFQYRLPKWGSLALGYGIGWRSSNITRSDYQQHMADLYFLALF